MEASDEENYLYFFDEAEFENYQQSSDNETVVNISHGLEKCLSDHSVSPNTNSYLESNNCNNSEVLDLSIKSNNQSSSIENITMGVSKRKCSDNSLDDIPSLIREDTTFKNSKNIEVTECEINLMTVGDTNDQIFPDEQTHDASITGKNKMCNTLNLSNDLLLEGGASEKETIEYKQENSGIVCSQTEISPAKRWKDSYSTLTDQNVQTLPTHEGPISQAEISKAYCKKEQTEFECNDVQNQPNAENVKIESNREILNIKTEHQDDDYVERVKMEDLAKYNSPFQGNSVERAKIENLVQNKSQFQNNSVERVKMEDLAKHNSPFQDNSVERAKIENFVQNNSQFQNNSVERVKMEDLAQNRLPFQKNSVERAKIENLVQNNSPFQNNSVERVKMDDLAQNNSPFRYNVERTTMCDINTCTYQTNYQCYSQSPNSNKEPNSCKLDVHNASDMRNIPKNVHNNDLKRNFTTDCAIDLTKEMCSGCTQRRIPKTIDTNINQNAEKGPMNYTERQNNCRDAESVQSPKYDIFFAEILKHYLPVGNLSCGTLQCNDNYYSKKLEDITSSLVTGFTKAHESFLERSKMVTKITNTVNITNNDLHNICSHLLAELIQFTVEFSECMRAFGILTNEQQKLQVKQSLLEMCVIYSCFWYSERSCDLLVEVYGLDVLKQRIIRVGSMGVLLHSLHKTISSLKLLKLRKEEFILMATMTLLSPDRSGSTKETISHLRKLEEIACVTLKWNMVSVHGDSANTLFERTIRKMVDIRLYSELHLQTFLMSRIG